MKYKLVWNDDAKEVGEKSYKHGQWSAKCPYGFTEAVIMYDRKYGYDLTVSGLGDNSNFYVTYGWWELQNFRDAKEWAVMKMEEYAEEKLDAEEVL